MTKTGIRDFHGYDALTSDRVYKKAIPHEQAANMILNGECGCFSSRLLDCFKNVEPQLADRCKWYRAAMYRLQPSCSATVVCRGCGEYWVGFSGVWGLGGGGAI